MALTGTLEALQKMKKPTGGKIGAWLSSRDLLLTGGTKSGQSDDQPDDPKVKPSRGKLRAWFSSNDLLSAGERTKSGRSESDRPDPPRQEQEETETPEEQHQHEESEYSRLQATTTGSLDDQHVIANDRRREHDDLRLEIVDLEAVRKIEQEEERKEQSEEEERKKRKGSFFEDMEANILRRLEGARATNEQQIVSEEASSSSEGGEEEAGETPAVEEPPSSGPNGIKQKDGGKGRSPPRRVISTKGNSVVIAKLLLANGGSNNKGQKERRRNVGAAAPLPGTAEEALEDSPRDSDDESEAGAPHPSRRRNSITCGATISAGSHAMSATSPDDEEAMIRCVCSIVWAHVLQSARNEEASSAKSLPSAPSDKYEVFNDRPSSPAAESSSTSSAAVPSLDNVVSFYTGIYRRTQMESDCIVISLVYVERLVKETDGSLRPGPANWMSVLASCLVLASKVWDDLSMDSGDFSRACRDVTRGEATSRFTPERILRLELAALGCLNFDARVSPSEYARYYFLLRSAMVRSGMANDDGQSPSKIGTIDIEEDRGLRQLKTSSKFRSYAARRRRSVGDVEEIIGRSSSMSRVKLERLVRL